MWTHPLTAATKHYIALFSPLPFAFSTACFYAVTVTFHISVVEIQSLLGMVRHGMGSFLVFVGLDGTKEELGIVSTNFWMYKDNDLDSL